MKISYRTHPALSYLKKGMPLIFLIDSMDQDYFRLYDSDFVDNFNANYKYFSKSINYISNSFQEACDKNIDKIKILYNDFVRNNYFNIDITAICDDFVYCLHWRRDQSRVNGELSFFVFTKSGIPVISTIGNFVSKTLVNDGITDIIAMTKPIIFYLFKKYAEVEIKELKPHSRTKDVNCKYINDTNLNITTLDSRWFTTLVKSDAFRVRGHFRLQPYKNEKREWDYKIIWINEFEKSGYTAPARKLALSQP